MSRTWYGNLNNRLAEGRQFVEEIKVGDGVTEYFYSDRHAYEVIAVADQKHITIREYDVECIGGAYSNEWKLISNPNNRAIDLVKRGNGWYIAKTATLEDLEEYEEAYRTRSNVELQLWWCHNGFDAEKIRKNGKQTKYTKMNISIGVADYHYDYEF